MARIPGRLSNAVSSDVYRRPLVLAEGLHVATTVPVPGCPALGAKPGSVLTTTILPQVPSMALPDFVIESATMTPMYDGTSLAGGVLLPGRVVNVVPHTETGVPAGSFVTVPAKPLNDSGAVPPVRLLWLHQESLHHVTFVVDVATETVRSPSTNAPRSGNVKTIAVFPVSDEGR